MLKRLHPTHWKNNILTPKDLLVRRATLKKVG